MDENSIILNNNDQSYSFKIDAKVMDGLYLTHSALKVDANIANLHLDIAATSNGIATKISKLGDVAILTLIANSERKYQYVVEKSLDFSTVEQTNSSQIPDQIKSLLKQTHESAAS